MVQSIPEKGELIEQIPIDQGCGNRVFHDFQFSQGDCLFDIFMGVVVHDKRWSQVYWVHQSRVIHENANFRKFQTFLAFWIPFGPKSPHKKFELNWCAFSARARAIFVYTMNRAAARAMRASQYKGLE